MNSYSKEIGGYFPLEGSQTPLYHVKNAIYVNSARNALRLAIRNLNINQVAIPYFTCPVVRESLLQENCHISYYDIDSNLEPDSINFPSDITIICNNYFGIKTKFVKKFTRKHPNTIVDNAQAFYTPNFGIASIYSPRKFFGLPDSGILISDKIPDKNLLLEQDTLSYKRCSHLLKRHDFRAYEGYPDFIENDNSLDNQPIKRISQLTRVMMGNLNYKNAKEKRRKNYIYLHKHLKHFNQLHLSIDSSDVPLIYPFLIERDGLREALIQNKIYIAKYWPYIEKFIPPSAYSLYLQKNLLALPIDQRYDQPTMEFLIKKIRSLI